MIKPAEINDMNDLAVEITKREGGQVNLSIAQVKEVIAHLSDIVYEDDMKPPRPGVDRISSMILFNGRRRHRRPVYRR